MKIKVLIHRAEEGGFWAEVPALPGCFSEGDTLEEMRCNIREAVEAILSIEPQTARIAEGDLIEELEV